MVLSKLLKNDIIVWILCVGFNDYFGFVKARLSNKGISCKHTVTPIIFPPYSNRQSIINIGEIQMILLALILGALVGIALYPALSARGN